MVRKKKKQWRGDETKTEGRKSKEKSVKIKIDEVKDTEKKRGEEYPTYKKCKPIFMKKKKIQT